MAKTSTNSIQNLDEDWGNDTNVNLPFDGAAVQAFIKSYLRKVTSAAYFDPTNYTMYFFASEEDRNSFINDPSQTGLPVFSCPMNFSSTLYRVDITNNTGTTQINTATNAGALTLSTTFRVQTKSITDPSWSDAQTGCYVTVLIDRGLTGTYTPITERALYAAGSTISLDVFSFLVNGTNRIKFQFDAEDGSVSQALVYTVTLAELYVELFNNTWYLPVLESDSATHRLGGFKIAGAGSKTLHLSLFGADGTKVVDDVTALIGTTNAYANTPYFFQIENGSPILDLVTGVYTVRAHVSTAALESEPVEYQIMFVAAEDTDTAKLVCINKVADKIFNYSSSPVCAYSVYDGSASYADLAVTFQHKHGSSVVSTESSSLEDVATRTEQTLTYEALWPGIEGSGYAIAFSIELGAAITGAEIPLDNSTVFPPTTGYDFYMLAANRNNGQSNKEKIVNVVGDSELAASWTEVDFMNGMDGWTTDDDGRACLRIPAKTKVILPHSAFNLLSGDNCTIELCYKVANVSNYDENVITISPNPSAAGFRGIRIKPNNITVHSSADTDASNDTQRGTNLCDDEVVHFALTINPNYEGSNRLVKAYINGNKNFLFSYGSSTDWNGFNGDLVIGSDHCDVFLYFVRHYPVALSDTGIQTNYINSLQTVAERNEMDAKFASVLDSGGTNVDFEAVRDNGFNYFIVSMAEGNGVPSAANGWGKKTTGVSTLEMHFGAHPEWDWKIEGVETMGQGTTSMNYYRWNVRWRIDKSNDTKKVPVSYVTERTKVGGKYQYSWGPSSSSKTVAFDGTNHPPVMRITAKINQASSMQSHKIGATRAYTELHDAIGLRNEAQSLADGSGSARPVVAVYQYPAFGFEYHNNNGEETYTFIGLFTIGPDKGDKPTFGFDAVKGSLISLEGTDHNQPLAKFAYPWTDDVNFFYNEEGLAIDLGEGNYLTGLEVGNCHGYDTDKASGQDSVRSVLAGSPTNEFKDAYNLVWQNSTLIFPITSDHPYYDSDVATTLANINSHLSGESYAENFRKGQYNSRLGYADMQFWIEGDSTYTLYYFDEKEAKYKPDISLATQNGAPAGNTAEEKNEWFKAKRRARFMASAAEYFDLDDSIYHYVFCLIFGATDNFAKNSYPYKMAALASGGRWKWRQDDLDTIFDIDNSGRDSKPYQIEFEDSVGGTPYFAGSNSVFWNLIHECYWDDYNNGAGSGIRTIGRNVISAMVRLSSANNPYDGFVKYISLCFWGNAQDYFPASAYNVDCTFKYEIAWLVNGQNVPPLSQALGNHYSGERLWVKRRAVYMLSLFRYGPFGDYSDTNLGTISFRPQSLSAVVTPLIWMYPALLVGQGTVITGGRTQPGNTAPLAAASDGNTAFYIQASNWLASLGNFKAVSLGLQDIGNITITGAKLIEFLIGAADAEEVTTNIPGLVFTNNRCLEIIDARNAVSLTAISGLANCPRLRTLLLAGTSVPSVDLAAGSKIETLSLPAATQRIVLRGLKHLSSLTVEGYAHVQTIHIEDTDVDAFAMLALAFDASEVLTYIRILWRGTYTDTERLAVNMLPSLAGAQYKGISSDGATVLDKPFIEGTIDVSAGGLTAGNIEDLQLDTEHQEDYDGNIKKVLSRLFNTSLYLLYDSSKIYISFADPEVERICVENWSSDGVGLTVAEAAAVTSFGTLFASNTLITSFNEQTYFTGLTTYGSSNPGTFSKCTSLVSVTVPSIPNPNSQTFERAFENCSALEVVTITAPMTPASTGGGSYIFNNCTSLHRVNIPNLEVWMQNWWNSAPFMASGSGKIYIDDVEVTEVVVPSSITGIRQRAFYGCIGIKSITIPSSVTSIATSAFYGCTGLTGTLTIPSSVTSIGAYAFQNCSGLTGLVIPDTITRLPVSVFSGCRRIEGTVVIPSSVTTIDGGALSYLGYDGNGIDFYYRASYDLTGTNSRMNRMKLKKLVVESSITTIGPSYFRSDQAELKTLTYVDLPSTITTISDAAFYGQPLETFIIRATTPPSLYNNAALNSRTTTINIYVPYSTDHSILNAYKSATIWSNFASRINELNPDGTIPS